MIHYFNPGHETALLNASIYYMAPANVVRMQKELAYLMAWQACSKDYIFLYKYPDNIFTEKVIEKFNLPIGIIEKDFESRKSEFENEKIIFWGISPDAVHLFQTINSKYELNLDIPQYKDILCTLSNRNFSRKCLEYITNKSSNISARLLPESCYSLEEIEKKVRKSPKQLLAKAPYSSSGRGLLWLPIGNLTRTEKQILHGTLKKQGSVSIEKALDKQLDFAMEFYLDGESIRLEGISLFKTNSKGAYLGNYLDTQKNIQSILSNYIQPEFLSEIKDILESFLLKNVSPHYRGYIGVDMMIYKENNEYKLQPCVEINLRNNMGIIATKISENFLSKNSYGNFYIDFNPKEGVILEKHMEMTNNYPLVSDGQKIKSGYLSLCPISETNKYRAYILIENKN